MLFSVTPSHTHTLTHHSSCLYPPTSPPIPPLSERVDQYSYGLVVWQMATSQTPFKNYTKEHLIREVAVEGRRPSTEHKHIPPALGRLIAACWHREPGQRPAFRQVVAELDSIIAAECGPDAGGAGSGFGSESGGVASSYWF